MSIYDILKRLLRLLIYNRTNSTYSAIVQYANQENEENLIELIDVYEETSNCTCDIKSHWLKYKIKGHEIEGILTIKYDNPCCL